MENEHTTLKFTTRGTGVIVATLEIEGSDGTSLSTCLNLRPQDMELNIQDIQVKMLKTLQGFAGQRIDALSNKAE